MLGLAILLGGTYLLVYMPLMWLPEDRDWFALLAPVPAVLVTLIWGLLQ